MRRGRIFLAIVGVFLVLVAIYVGFNTEGAAEYAALGIGSFGVILIATAAFASDRTVNVIQALLTGWP